MSEIIKKMNMIGKVLADILYELKMLRIELKEKGRNGETH